MTWKGISPVIKLVKIVYQKGVRITKKAFNALANRIDRDASLPKYYLTIRPQAKRGVNWGLFIASCLSSHAKVIYKPSFMNLGQSNHKIPDNFYITTY